MWDALLIWAFKKFDLYYSGRIQLSEQQIEDGWRTRIDADGFECAYWQPPEFEQS